MLYRGFCFFAILFFVPFVWAQGVDDIPFFLFDDDDDRPVKQTPAKPKTPEPAKKQPAKVEQEQPKPIKFNAPSQPNIGLNAEPLTKLTVTTPPLPEVSFDLTDPQPQPVQPLKPLNLRTQDQGIDILSTALLDSAIPDTLPVAGGEIGMPQSVRGFELEGFYLGMDYEDVLELVRENGYKIVSSKNTISKFRTGYYESLCKSKGILAP